MVRAKKNGAARKSIALASGNKNKVDQPRQTSPVQAEITRFFVVEEEKKTDIIDITTTSITTTTAVSVSTSNGEEQVNGSCKNESTTVVASEEIVQINTSIVDESTMRLTCDSPISPHHKILLEETKVPQIKLKPSQKNNRQITEFFAVRRSSRKPKATLEEERNKDIEDAILNAREEGLEVRVFSEKGRGVVANKNFTRGEFVVEYAGELISTTEAKSREQKYAADQNTGCYMYYFKHKNTQYCIDATAETERLGRLVNHSRQGNLQTRTVTVKDKPHLVLVARCNIAAGDEVLYDYGDRSRESLMHHPWLAS